MVYCKDVLPSAESLYQLTVDVSESKRKQNLEEIADILTKRAEKGYFSATVPTSTVLDHTIIQELKDSGYDVYWSQSSDTYTIEWRKK